MSTKFICLRRLRAGDNTSILRIVLLEDYQVPIFLDFHRENPDGYQILSAMPQPFGITFYKDLVFPYERFMTKDRDRYVVLGGENLKPVCRGTEVVDLTRPWFDHGCPDTPGSHYILDEDGIFRKIYLVVDTFNRFFAYKNMCDFKPFRGFFANRMRTVEKMLQTIRKRQNRMEGTSNSGVYLKRIMSARLEDIAMRLSIDDLNFLIKHCREEDDVDYSDAAHFRYCVSLLPK